MAVLQIKSREICPAVSCPGGKNIGPVKESKSKDILDEKVLHSEKNSAIENPASPAWKIHGIYVKERLVISFSERSLEEDFPGDSFEMISAIIFAGSLTEVCYR